jgi:hypothetical protein
MSDVLLAHYQRILELTNSMLSEGLAQNWGALVSLEEQRQLLLETIPASSSDTPKIDLIELIRKIKDSDEVLCEKIEVWLKHARGLLQIQPEHPTR